MIVGGFYAVPSASIRVSDGLEDFNSRPLPHPNTRGLAVTETLSLRSPTSFRRIIYTQFGMAEAPRWVFEVKLGHVKMRVGPVHQTHALGMEVRDPPSNDQSYRSGTRPKSSLLRP